MRRNGRQRPDHRGNRHGQGTVRPGNSPQQPSRGQAFCHRGLRGFAGASHRERTVRSCQGGFHRSRSGEKGADRASRRGYAFPGRSGRAAPCRPEIIPEGAAGAPLSAGGRRPGAGKQFQAGCGHPSRSGSDGGRRSISKRPALPPADICHSHSPAAGPEK